MSARKSRKRRSIESSSEEEDDLGYCTPMKKQEEKSTRSSDRISARKNKTFKMPSRDDVWDNILPTKSPDKYYHLKPRKLINNFTKENNSYNYDPIYTSGSESMEDFIDDDIQYRKKRKKQKTVHRIRNRHTRVIQVSSDSNSSSDNEATNRINTVAEDKQDVISVNEQETAQSSEITQEPDSDRGDNDNSKCGVSSASEISQNMVKVENIKVEVTGNPYENSKTTNDLPGTSLGKELECSEVFNKIKNVEGSDTGMSSKDSKSNSGDDSDFGQNFVKSKSKQRKGKVLESDSENETKPELNDPVIDPNLLLDGDQLGNQLEEDENVVQCKRKRRKSKVLESDSEDENETKTEIQDTVDDPNQTPATNQLENQLVDQLEDQSEYEIVEDGIVYIHNSTDDNDSFVVDDDCESSIEDNSVSDVDDVEEEIDENSDNSDPQEGTSCGRKKHVRVKMVQKQKERNELFDQFRAVRQKKQAKLKKECSKK